MDDHITRNNCSGLQRGANNPSHIKSVHLNNHTTFSGDKGSPEEKAA
jgi:hypothetical protein